MDLYGPSLGQLLKLCGGKFSKRTVAILALQILDRIEVMHSHNYLHLDLRPENFLMGLGSNSYLLYMIDFSNSQQYKIKDTHISYQSRSYELDPNFASVGTQLNLQPSRRDEI